MHFWGNATSFFFNLHGAIAPCLFRCKLFILNELQHAGRGATAQPLETQRVTQFITYKACGKGNRRKGLSQGFSEVIFEDLIKRSLNFEEQIRLFFFIGSLFFDEFNHSLVNVERANVVFSHNFVGNFVSLINGSHFFVSF
jgi:hypothetical protein